ncbi:hypothetical protein BSM4216_2452 [Bacillus smithii]|nr:hypothetical protein BSM4216_2452 [Bacillus smithii]
MAVNGGSMCIQWIGMTAIISGKKMTADDWIFIDNCLHQADQ